MSFTQQIQESREKKGIYYILAPDATERMAWYYLRVFPEKMNGFKTALAKKWLGNLANWGEVLESAYGERSPDDIREKMKEKYGFEHSNL